MLKVYSKAGFKTQGSSISMLKESDLQLIKEQKVSLNCFSNKVFVQLMNVCLAKMDFTTLASELRQAPLPYGFEWFKAEWKSHYSQDNNVILALEYEATAYGKSVELERHIINEGYNIIAKHVFLGIPKELQGRGISRRINSILYNQYKISGIKVIRLEAGLTDGGYVWALAGFYATEEDHVRKIMKSAREKADRNVLEKKTSTLTPTLCDYLEELIDLHYGLTPKGYFPMQNFSDLDCAEEILKDTTWSGELNLACLPQTTIFDEYLTK